MSNYEPDNKLLASLAVFRTLYDNKKDVVSVISDFVHEIIVSTNRYRFNLKEISNLLNSTYDFNLPEPIVEASLKSLPFLKRDSGFYYVKDIADLKSTDLSEKQSEIQTSNDLIISRLFDYIVDKEKRTLKEKEKEKIIESFCSFLLDESDNSDYYKDISAFYVHNKSDVAFAKQLKLIKEGVVLYSGIKYCNNLKPKGIWDTKLTIYVDTEVLFYFAGYDGKIYQSLFIDFLEYIKEINFEEELIQLLYFDDVVNEIERFFAKAEQIVEGKDKLDPSRTAMATICNGCESGSDIQIKKAAFFDLLSRNKIKKDNYQDYFEPYNHEFNISDTNTIDIISKSLGKINIAEHIRFLNYISIHRKNDAGNNFENIGCILLSANHITQRVAWHNEIKSNGNVPLVTNINFLTTKLWFKLNKGFGGNNYPKSFDILTKSQIILSSQISDSVGTQYEQLQARFKEKEITEDVAIATIANLRSQILKPEEIKDSNLDSVLTSISESSIERYILEQEHLKSEVIRESKEKVLLQDNLNKSAEQLDEYAANHNILSSEIIQGKKKLLEEKISSISIIENLKSPIDMQIKSTFRNFKVFIFLIFVAFYCGTYYLLNKFGWDSFEQWTWIMSTIPIIFYLSFLLIKERQFNPVALLKIQRAKIQMQKYSKFNIDLDLLKKLNAEKIEIEKELRQ
jgi:hypothetical protein